MSKLTNVEVTRKGTITRACARAINRAHGTAFSGSTLANDALAALADAGVQVRVLEAAALTGADKAKHTREVTRSRNAQARRVERKAAEKVAA